MDDLLLTSLSVEDCQRATRNLLEELGRLVYCASSKKAQMCKQLVIHLVYKLKEGAQSLTAVMKETSQISHAHLPMRGVSILRVNGLLQTLNTELCTVGSAPV